MQWHALHDALVKSSPWHAPAQKQVLGASMWTKFFLVQLCCNAAGRKRLDRAEALPVSQAACVHALLMCGRTEQGCRAPQPRAAEDALVVSPFSLHRLASQRPAGARAYWVDPSSLWDQQAMTGWSAKLKGNTTVAEGYTMLLPSTALHELAYLCQALAQSKSLRQALSVRQSPTKVIANCASMHPQSSLYHL